MIRTSSLLSIDHEHPCLECDVHTTLHRTLAMLALAGLVLSGCRLDVTAEAELEQDGTGVASLVLRMDDALLDTLDDLAIDPTIEVTAAAAEADGWTLERSVDDQQAITIRLSHPVEDPADIGDAYRGLATGLTDEDPALLIDLDVALDEDGRTSTSGSIGFRPPQMAGVVIDDDPLGPSAEELGQLTDEMVRPRLELTLPGPVTSHDGDRLDGRTVGWDVPVDGSRPVAAASDAPGIHEQPWLWVTVAGILAVVAGVAALLRRRPRRRPAAHQSRGLSSTRVH